MENGDINRLVGVMAEMLEEQRLTRAEIKSMKEKTESGFTSLNLAVGELRLFVMKLAKELEALHDHENRIVKIEKVVFK
jgi:hypothetical protein